MLKSQLAEFRTHVHDLTALRKAAEVLRWDSDTTLPPEGVTARGRQLAVLEHVIHEKLTSKALGQLLGTFVNVHDSLTPEDATLVRVMREDFERAGRVPASFLLSDAAQANETYQAWRVARSENNFALVAPHLEKRLELSREYAGFFPEHQHLADPLIDEADPGVSVAELKRLFARLREVLVPMLQNSVNKAEADDSMLRQTFEEPLQLAFGNKVVQHFGFDRNRGRVDLNKEPSWATVYSAGIDDVRMTTFTNPHDFVETFLTFVHEAGHALYEQGFARTLEHTPLAAGASAGLHESQARLWENQVGRSLEFWQYFYPQLQQHFPKQLSNVSLRTFYQSLNRVKPTFIRYNADEVGYNLHVMIRFELECELLEGNLLVRDLPEAWNARYQQDLGILPTTLKDGVLQDVHWFSGRVGGAFQSYTLGNVMSSQLYAAALRAHPDIPKAMAEGEFGVLLGWLQENVYRYGRTLKPGDIIKRVTGAEVTPEPYLQYLNEKYS